jgi:N6-L-threonylcarbamoyladenine synthase
MEYRLLGQTRDDAAGEAYDKVAKLLGLGYPGGKVVDDLACQGDPDFHKFPRAFIRDDSYEFSFSGLKTAVLLYLREQGEEFVKANLTHICAAFQEAVVDVLVEKTILAVEKTDCRRIALAGGVAANSRLRDKLKSRAKQAEADLYFPPLQLCTDNAAMIAAAGHCRLNAGESSALDLNAYPYLPLVE